MARVAPATDKMKRATDHGANAQIYSAWAGKEIALAERKSDPYVQRDHLARAENYIRLVEMELLAAMRRLNASRSAPRRDQQNRDTSAGPRA